MHEWYFIGTNKIHKSVTLGENVVLGENNVIYPNVVIGLPGFIRDSESATGKVIIGNNNWLGCNVSVMVGATGDTIIGNDNLIMNYVNIGHNTKIGNGNEIGAGTIVPGWVEIGNNNKIKLHCTFRNRKKISNGIIVGMGSNIVTSFMEDNILVYGNPAKKIKNLDDK